MEIKPYESESLFADLLMKFLEILTKSLLWSFLVNEVNNCAIFVVLFDVLVILSGYFEINFIISVNVNFWVPLKIWILSPEEWHWTSELNMREYIFFTSILSKEN